MIAQNGQIVAKVESVHRYTPGESGVSKKCLITSEQNQPLNILRPTWLIEVLPLGEANLDERPPHLALSVTIHPGNQNVRPKIRQQLQYLRNRGFVDFVSRGNYRLRT
jgi:hypothetical protein